jgi:TonB-linked SusC/RagA family outer membrane protein
MKIINALSRLALVGALLLIATASSFAQMQGKITDSGDNSPLIGASVVVKGTTKGAITDADGQFSLDAKKGDMLVVSFIGYETQEIAFDGTSSFSLALKPQSAMLQEVVATALDIKKSKASLGYAVQDVKGADLVKAREPNPVNSLVGKVAGLTVGASAELLGAPNVLLRGKSPLYVVDGVPIITDTWNISNDDIESITVLKGPTASALYGSRGQFGAIQITTKRGTKDKRGISIEVNNSTMVDNGFLTIPKVQDEYGPGDHGTYSFVDGKGGGRNDGDYDIWGPKLDGRLLPQFDSPIDPATGKRTATPWVPRGKDNLTRYLRPGVLNNTNITVAGSTDKFDFRLSGSYAYQQGLVPNTQLNTGNFNFSSGYKFTDKLKFESNINFNRQFTDNFPDVVYGPNSMIYNVIIWAGADWDVEAFNPKTGGSYWQKGREGVQQIYAEYQRYNNPYFQSYEWLRGHYKNDIYGYAKLNYEIAPKLNLMARTQVTTYDLFRDEKMPYSGGSYGRDERRGDYREDKRNLFENNTDVLLSYDVNLTNDFNVKASVGGNMRNMTYRSSFTTTDYLNVPGLYTFTNSLNPIRSSNFGSQAAVYSGYGLADLSYKTWAYLSVTGRLDKSSMLLPKKSSYFYPSVSLSVLPSEMTKLGPVSFLKFRGSYAKVGGDLSQSTIGPNNSFLGYGENYRTPYGGPNYFTPTYSISQPYNNQAAATYSRALLDGNLEPSFSTSYEFGGEIKVLNNRLGLDVNYFVANDGPNIFNLTVPESSGATSIITNGIKTQRKGLELILSGMPVKTKDFNWNITANWSTFKETLKEVYDGVDRISQFIKVGDRVDKYYGSAFVRTGTTTQDGIKVYDKNTPIVYSGGQPLRAPVAQFLGYINPDWVWGVNNTLTYKGFGVGFQFDGRVGGVIWNYIERQTFRGGRHIATVEGAMGVARNADQVSIDKAIKEGRSIKADIDGNWTGQGVVITNGVSPNYDADGFLTNGEKLNTAANTTKTFLQDWISRYYGTDEAVVTDRTFMKLREVTLSYTLPSSILAKGFVKGATLSLTGRNLALWSEKKDMDVDQFVAGSSAVLQTPTMRRFGVNLNITF